MKRILLTTLQYLPLCLNLVTTILIILLIGKFECSQEQMSALVTQLSELNGDRPLSKAQACDYLNISRSTFDKLVKDGKLPKGLKKMGFKELSWTKELLNQYDRK